MSRPAGGSTGGSAAAAPPENGSAERAPGGLRGRYGASPWHLVAMGGCLLLSAYAASRIFDNPSLLRIAVWFVGAAIVWDLLLGPLLALVDRALLPLRRGPGGVALLNHVRVPLLLSALLFLVWAPVILQRSERTFQLKAGLKQDPYLERWLLITLAAFVVSGIVYVVRLRTGRTPVAAAEPSPRTDP